MAAAESSQDKHRSALRKQCLALRNQIDPALKQAYDACIITRLMQWLEGQKPEDASQALLALWWPIGSEPDWRPFAPALRKAGWRLALPCVMGPQQALRFAVYEDATELRRAAMGIHEPVRPDWIQPWVLSAPCVGFYQRYRLGYGGGYYDRSIAGLDQEARKRTVAIGYSICEVVFEPQAHDLAFAAVISERALHA